MAKPKSGAPDFIAMIITIIMMKIVLFEGIINKEENPDAQKLSTDTKIFFCSGMTSLNF